MSRIKYASVYVMFKGQIYEKQLLKLLKQIFLLVKSEDNTRMITIFTRKTLNRFMKCVTIQWILASESCFKGLLHCPASITKVQALCTCLGLLYCIHCMKRPEIISETANDKNNDFLNDQAHTPSSFSDSAVARYIQLCTV